MVRLTVGAGAQPLALGRMRHQGRERHLGRLLDGPQDAGRSCWPTASTRRRHVEAIPGDHHVRHRLTLHSRPVKVTFATTSSR